MAVQMVRYVMTAAMRFVQRLDVYRRQQHARQWQQHDPRAPAQVEVGVMGLGVIGGAIAQALVAEGFRVRGFASTGKQMHGIACFAGRHELGAFLDGLDMVINVLPATADTQALLDRASLSRLRDGAHVVNIGRGSVLVEADLLALLDEGKLSGATLDVFSEEPLPPDHPFWSRPDITITPHVAGLTIPEETVVQIVDKIRKLERGEAVTGVVDRARGY
jgi:glyoxylate/hydroxypyruvate reductase